MFFRQILENKFDLINIFKLYINISLVRLISKLIKLKKDVKINTRKDNTKQNIIKKLEYLFYFYKIY